MLQPPSPPRKVQEPLQQAVALAPVLPQQVPLQQTLPLAHALVQEPQWLGSAFVLTQAPLQLVVPLGQPVPQLPFAQVWPEPHTLPQMPQLLLSVSVFTQALPHTD